MEETKTVSRQTNLILWIAVFFIAIVFALSATDMGKSYLGWLKAGIANFFPSEALTDIKEKVKVPNFSYLNTTPKEETTAPVVESKPTLETDPVKLEAIKKQVDEIAVKVEVLKPQVREVVLNDVQTKIGQISSQIDKIGQEISALRTLQ